MSLGCKDKWIINLSLWQQLKSFVWREYQLTLEFTEDLNLKYELLDSSTFSLIKNMNVIKPWFNSFILSSMMFKLICFVYPGEDPSMDNYKLGDISTYSSILKDIEINRCRWALSHTEVLYSLKPLLSSSPCNMPLYHRKTIMVCVNSN